MYDVRKNGRVYDNNTGELVSTFTDNLLLETDDKKVGTIFAINYKYESRVTGISILDLKKIYESR